MPGYAYKVQTRYLFRCHVRIKIPEWYPDKVFDKLYSVMEDVNAKYNSYVKGSYFDTINRNAGKFVETDKDTLAIFEKSTDVSRLTDGLYDITVMPLVRLWGFYNDHKTIPSEEEIQNARSRVDYSKIQITQNKVRTGKGQEIITGSFVKAFAADKLKEEMQKLGIDDAIVNAGGSTILAVNNKQHPRWKINVYHPGDKQKLFEVAVSGQCYSTSEQSSYVEIDGKRFGHIINPKTGYPSTNKQIGLITDDCLTGDMLSTALFNESGRGFLEKTARFSRLHGTPVEGFLIDGNDQIYFTLGFKNNILCESMIKIDS